MRHLRYFIFAVLLLPLVPTNNSYAQPASADVGPRIWLYYLPPNYILDTSQSLSTAERNEAARYHVISSTPNAGHIGQIKGVNPDLIAMFPIGLHGVIERDYSQSFFVGDTLTHLQRRIDHAYQRNLLDYGVDWAYKTVDDENIIIWGGTRACNWTSDCPLGQWGDTKGKTFAEYVGDLIVQMMGEGTFTAVWDGIAFDTYPPECCYLSQFDDVDYNYDGIADGCIDGVCTDILDAADGSEPWIEEEDRVSREFWKKILDAKPEGFYLTSGQDWLRGEDRHRASGWKVEGYLNHNSRCGGVPWWQCWWDGTYHNPGGIPGYDEAHQALDDSTSLTLLDVAFRPTDPPARQVRLGRIAVATSLLHEGLMAYTLGWQPFGPGMYRTIPEMFDWRVDLATGGIGGPYQQGDTMRRKWLTPEGDSALVMVSNIDAATVDGVDGHYFLQGACCFAADSCAVIFEIDCTESGGAYAGDGVECDPNPCGVGACCTTIGVCTIEDLIDCVAPRTFMGAGTVCDPTPCPNAPGACCHANDTCTLTSQNGCTLAGGEFRGVDTTCEPNLCAIPVGSCCYLDGTCEVTTEEDCDATPNSIWTEDGDCEAQFGGSGNCAEGVGACCSGDVCDLTTEAGCAANFLGLGVPCDPNPCSFGEQPQGACCVGNGDCVVATEEDCATAGGSYVGDDTDCDPSPCCIAVTIPAVLDADSTVYCLSPNDSTAWESTTNAIVVTGDYVTLLGNNHLITRASGSNEGLEVLGSNFVVKSLRTRNFRQEITGDNFRMEDCEFTNQTVGTLSSVIIDGAVGGIIDHCKILSGTTGTALAIQAGSADIAIEGSLVVSYNSRAMTIDATCGDVTAVNSTIVTQSPTASHNAIGTSQANPNKLTLYNNIIASESATALSAADNAWTGLDGNNSNNFFRRESGSILVRYKGLDYTSASAFEPNSLHGNPGFVDDNDSYNGDYCIQAGSAPVNKGANDKIRLPLDINGAPRIQDSFVDMGCCETTGPIVVLGACCAGDGTCTIKSEAACIDDYQGDWTVCLPNPCPQAPTGACCFQDGTCSVTTSTGCASGGGIYQGNDAACSPNPCPQPTGACCVDFACSIQTASACTTAGGTYQGDGTTCVTGLCDPPSGSCCLTNGTCSITFEDDCVGVWIEDGVCSPNPCDDQGACCVAQACTITREVFCTGVYQGDGSTCDPDPCVAPGCPGPGEVEINSFPVSFGAGQAGNKYAICGTLVIPANAPYERAINIDANNIEIRGHGVGKIVVGPGSGTSHEGIRVQANRKNVLIDGIDFDFSAPSAGGSLRVLSDSTRVSNCNFYGWGPFFEPKGDSEAGSMTYSGMDSCSVIFPFQHPSRVNVVSFGSSAADAINCYFRNNYVWAGTNPSPDGVGLSMARWFGGDVSGNTIIIHDGTFKVEPIKALEIEGVLFENNYVYAPGAHFCSFREGDAAKPWTHSHSLTIRNNRFIGGWKAVSIDADSSVVENNVFMGGFAGLGNGYIFRVSSSVDTIRVENNLILATNGLGVQWQCGGEEGVVVRGNTAIAAGGATSAWDIPASSRTGFFQNNIFASLTNAPALTMGGFNSDHFEMDHNLFYRADGGTVINWLGTNYSSVSAWHTATGFGSASIGANPLFVDARSDTLGNFRLTDVSPAIDAGDSTLVQALTDLDGFDRVVGLNVDLGPFEEGAGVVDPVGGCCYADGSCSVLSEAVCIATGGIYEGDETDCSPNPCPQPTGRCCFSNGSCVDDQTESECIVAGGIDWLEGETCAGAPCEQPTGACCDSDGDCLIVEEELCGDDYLGDGTICSPNPCPQPTGACCEFGFISFTCAITTEANCEGDYQGDGTTCSPDPCVQPTGACCTTGVCAIETQADCVAADGDYQGDGTVCSPNPCPQPAGACCAPDGACTIRTQAACAGDYQGHFTVCNPNPCPDTITGACCFADDGTCQELNDADCATAGGTYQGDGTDCSPNLCPQPLGACCTGDAVCTLLTEEDCTGTFEGDNTECSPNPCPQLGACCFGDMSCQMLTEAECNSQSGGYQGDETDCIDNPCGSPTGACCFASDGTCSIVTEYQCDQAGGAYQGGNEVCDPNPCPQPEWACCLGTDCQVLTEDDCTIAGGTWMPGKLCTPMRCFGDSRRADEKKGPNPFGFPNPFTIWR